MAKDKQLNRLSNFSVSEHRNDKDLNLGYDYRETLLDKSISSVLYGDDKRNKILKRINDLCVYMVDSVKNIKKTFIYSVPRNSRNIN